MTDKLYTQAEVNAKVAAAEEAIAEEAARIAGVLSHVQRDKIRALIKTPGNLATFEAEIRRQERGRVMLEVKSWPYVPFGTYEQWVLFIESKLTAPPESTK